MKYTNIDDYIRFSYNYSHIGRIGLLITLGEAYLTLGSKKLIWLENNWKNGKCFEFSYMENGDLSFTRNAIATDPSYKY